MEPATYTIPLVTMRSDYSTFRVLAELAEFLYSTESDAIRIDFSKVTWFDAHLGAALQALKQNVVHRNIQLSLRGVNSELRKLLRGNGTLEHSSNDHPQSVPISLFSKNDGGVAFAKYTNLELKKRKFLGIPLDLRSGLLEVMDEAFANCTLHSESHWIICGGQRYPSRDEFCFVICDGGQGFLNEVKKMQPNFSREVEAIQWAMGENNTTRSGDIPGGLGLSVIQDFAESFNAEITLVSRRGFWKKHGGTIIKRDLPREFPGTLLEISVPLSLRRGVKREAKNSNTDDIW